MALAPRPKPVVEGAHYPEGPLWVDGSLHWVEFARDAVMRLERDGPQVLWSSGGVGPAAVAAGADDDLWVTGYGDNSVVRIGRDGVLREVIYRDSAGQALLGPNDLVMDDVGGLYFTASGVFERDAPIQGRVCYRTVGGTIKTVAEGIHYANGVALSADGRRLFVAEHFCNRILCFDVDPDGSLRGRRVHVDLNMVAPISASDPKLGPDGLKVTSRDVVIVAQYGGGRLVVVDKDGSLLDTCALPGLRYSTNVGFGETEETLFVTAFGLEEPPFLGKVLCVEGSRW